MPGCATVITQKEIEDKGYADGPFTGQKIESRIYSGFNFCIKAQLAPIGSGGNIGGLIFLVDLPLSLMADTVILPYSLYRESK